ncbi:ATP-binding cassette domain-containing protein [Desulfovibrio inopinatus]|uniref:ATP-binding cassette domain-containing protein n=1 Tax=Desulfovibrio inopinatus TaxID=102109 RepID=UPI00041B46A1|nr:ATP-binding cassette domain-containing protein [Desulfovibrio inopinatus]
MIEAEHLSMNYGPVNALDDAGFVVQKGQILGLLGPNGAGKSTIMKILTTYLHPTKGTARICGFDILKNPLEVRKRIGYLPENLPLYLGMEVGEYLDFVAEARGLRGADKRLRIRWVLDHTGLGPMLHRPIIELSKGYRQRTALAQALVHDPEVVILDEPTTGLDPHQILDIRRLISELAKDKTVIFSTHILQEVEAIAERVVIIADGRIKADGPIEELAAKAEVQEEVNVLLLGPPQHFEPSLSALDGVTKIRQEHAPQGFSRFILSCDNAMAQTASIYSLAVAQNWELAELAQNTPSLEAIFLALTKAENPLLEA